MNGTTGASHSTGASVNVYQYPQEVVNACYLQAGRISKRWQTAYASSLGTPEMSPFDVSTNLDGDVQRLLQKFRITKVG